MFEKKKLTHGNNQLFVSFQFSKANFCFIMNTVILIFKKSIKYQMDILLFSFQLSTLYNFSVSLLIFEYFSVNFKKTNKNAIDLLWR